MDSQEAMYTALHSDFTGFSRSFKSESINDLIIQIINSDLPHLHLYDYNFDKVLVLDTFRTMIDWEKVDNAFLDSNQQLFIVSVGGRKIRVIVNRKKLGSYSLFVEFNENFWHIDPKSVDVCVKLNMVGQVRELVWMQYPSFIVGQVREVSGVLWLETLEKYGHPIS